MAIVLFLLCWIFRICLVAILIMIALRLLFKATKVALLLASPILVGALIVIVVVTAPVTLLMRMRGSRFPFFLTYYRAISQRIIDGYPLYSWKTYRVRLSQFENQRRQKQQQKQYYKEESETHYGNANSHQASEATNKSDPWSILGVSYGAPVNDIKAAYYKKMSENHPDKVAQLDPALQKFATERTVMIKRAYDAALQEKTAA